MPEYIVDPLPDSDSDRMQQDAFDFLIQRWANWSANEGNLETWMIAGLARMVAEARDVASDVPPAIFKFFGQHIVGVPPVAETPATVAATININDNSVPRTIAQGTLFGIQDAFGDMFTFEVQADVTVTSPATSTLAGEVILVATLEGVASNALGGIGSLAVNVEGITWIDTVVLTGATSGGTDEEDDDTYLNRLSDRLTVPPSPVLPQHFATIARDVAAQMGIRARILALDGWDPATSTSNNEKMVALAGVDIDTGANLTTPVKTAIDVEITARREWNFVVNMIDPTRTTIDVTFVAVSTPGADPVAVHDNAVGAVQNFLSDLNWGVTGESPFDWLNQPVVRHQDLSTILNNVAGLDHWTTLTFRTGAGAFATTDITLTGAAPLAVAGVVTGTVT